MGFGTSETRRVNCDYNTTLPYRPSTTAPAANSISISPGPRGWICPVCGRGLAPSTSYCPCYQEKSTVMASGLNPNIYGDIFDCGNDRIDVTANGCVDKVRYKQEPEEMGSMFTTIKN